MAGTIEGDEFDVKVGVTLREGETIAAAIGDQVRLGRILGPISIYRRSTGDHARALEYAQRAYEIATTHGEVGLRVENSIRLGWVYHSRGDYRRAMELFRENLTALPAVLSRYWLGWSLAECGEFADGLLHADEALRIAAVVDHTFSRVSAS